MCGHPQHMGIAVLGPLQVNGGTGPPGPRLRARAEWRAAFGGREYVDVCV